LHKNIEPILDKLNLTAYQRTTIIDMNPNLGIFSAALHERLKPKQHILLEPVEAYGDTMREFQKTYKNSWYVPLDGYDWGTYNKLFSEDPLPPPWPNKFPKPEIKASLSSEDINADLLFVGHMGKLAKSERLMAQFISCCALGSWIQRYGRVRFLLWVPDTIKDKYLPRSITTRARPSATAEAIVDITEVATSNVIRTGRGHPKIPVINQDNVHLEEGKPGPSKRQEIKSEIQEKIELRVRTKLVEDEIKKLVVEDGIKELVAEELGLAKTHGRSKKLSREEKRKLARTTARIRKAVEEIRDGGEPKPPHNFPAWRRMMLLDRYDEIRRTFGYKTKAEPAAEKDKEKEKKERRKLELPKKPGRPRRLPQRSRPATTEELEAIEERINNKPELWIRGMEHPPWYYQGNKEELRELAIRIAAMYPALCVDPKEALQPENVYGTMIGGVKEAGGLPEGATTGEGPSATSAGVGKEGGKSATRAWEEYEEQWPHKHKIRARDQSREDQIYAAHNKLLKIYDRPYEPVLVNPKGDFFPHVPHPPPSHTPYFTS